MSEGKAYEVAMVIYNQQKFVGRNFKKLNVDKYGLDDAVSVIEVMSPHYQNYFRTIDKMVSEKI